MVPQESVDYAPSKPSTGGLFNDALNAQEKLIMENYELSLELEDKLRSVLVPAEEPMPGVSDKTQPSAYSPTTSALLDFNDRLSRNNRQLRRIIKNLDV